MAALATGDGFGSPGAERLERVLGTVTSGAVSWPGFRAAPPPRSGEVGGDDGNGDAVAARLVRALGELHGIAIARRRYCVALRMAGALPVIVRLPVTGDRRLLASAALGS